MKNLINLFLISILFFSLVSCDDNDALLEKTEIDANTGEEIIKEYDATIYVSEDGLENTLEETVNVETAQEVKVKISFKSEENPLRRLYITENIAAAGATPYVLVLEEGVKVDTKADGSIDIQTKYKDGFDFVFKMTAPELGEGITEGTVVYDFWTTTGRGDFRDTLKNQALKVGTITFKYGRNDEVVNIAQMKEYSATMLFVPLKDGTSETFMSLFDGKTYKINQGVEFAAFWDFGFFYGTNAQLFAAKDYPVKWFTEPALVDVVKAIKEEGNTMKFKLSDKDEKFFNALSTTNLEDMEIDTITETSIIKLEVGNIIEFIDNYGKRGFMMVTGLNKTYNKEGYIKINIKMQS